MRLAAMMSRASGATGRGLAALSITDNLHDVYIGCNRLALSFQKIVVKLIALVQK